MKVLTSRVVAYAIMSVLVSGASMVAYADPVPVDYKVVTSKAYVDNELALKQNVLPAKDTATTQADAVPDFWYAPIGGQTIALGSVGVPEKRYITKGLNNTLTDTPAADPWTILDFFDSDANSNTAARLMASNNFSTGQESDRVLDAIVSLELLRDVYKKLDNEIQNAIPTGPGGNVAMYDPNGDLGDGVATYSGATTQNPYNAGTDANKIATAAAVETKQNVIPHVAAGTTATKIVTYPGAGASDGVIGELTVDTSSFYTTDDSHVPSSKLVASQITANDVRSHTVNGAPLSNTASYFYGEGYGDSDVLAKTVLINSIDSRENEPTPTGQMITVQPNKTALRGYITLKLNKFNASPVYYKGNVLNDDDAPKVWNSEYPSTFVFDGSNWVFMGNGQLDTDTTYPSMGVSEGTTGSAQTQSSLTAKNLKQIIQGTTLTGVDTTATTAVTASDTVTTGIGKLQGQVSTKQNKIAATSDGANSTPNYVYNATTNPTADGSVITTTTTAGTTSQRGIATAATRDGSGNLTNGNWLPTISAVESMVSDSDISSHKVNGAPLSNTASYFYGEGVGAADTATKTVSIPSITGTPAVGQVIVVKPATTNTSSTININLNNTAAYSVLYRGSSSNIPKDVWTAYVPSIFVLDETSGGTKYWRYVGTSPVAMTWFATETAASNAYSTTFDGTTNNWPVADENKYVKGDSFAQGLALKQNKIATNLVSFTTYNVPALVSYGTGTNNADGILGNKIGIVGYGNIGDSLGDYIGVGMDNYVPTVYAVAAALSAIWDGMPSQWYALSWVVGTDNGANRINAINAYNTTFGNGTNNWAGNGGNLIDGQFLANSLALKQNKIPAGTTPNGLYTNGSVLTYTNSAGTVGEKYIIGGQTFSDLVDGIENWTNDYRNMLVNAGDIYDALSLKQSKIPAGTAGEILTYSGTAGQLGTPWVVLSSLDGDDSDAIEFYSTTFDGTDGNWTTGSAGKLITTNILANGLALKQTRISTGLVEFEGVEGDYQLPAIIRTNALGDTLDGTSLGIFNFATYQREDMYESLPSYTEYANAAQLDNFVPTLRVVAEELKAINNKQSKLPAEWTNTTSTTNLASTGGQTIDLGSVAGAVGRRYITAGGSQPLTQKNGADNVILYINGTKTLAQYQTSNFGATSTVDITKNQNYIKGALVSLELLKDVYGELNAKITNNALPTGTAGTVVTYNGTNPQTGVQQFTETAIVDAPVYTNGNLTNGDSLPSVEYVENALDTKQPIIQPSTVSGKTQIVVKPAYGGTAGEVGYLTLDTSSLTVSDSTVPSSKLLSTQLSAKYNLDLILDTDETDIYAGGFSYVPSWAATSGTENLYRIPGEVSGNNWASQVLDAWSRRQNVPTMDTLANSLAGLYEAVGGSIDDRIINYQETSSYIVNSSIIIPDQISYTGDRYLDDGTQLFWLPSLALAGNTAASTFLNRHTDVAPSMDELAYALDGVLQTHETTREWQSVAGYYDLREMSSLFELAHLINSSDVKAMLLNSSGYLQTFAPTLEALMNESYGLYRLINVKQDKLSGTNGNLVTYGATPGATGSKAIATTITNDADTVPNTAAVYNAVNERQIKIPWAGQVRNASGTMSAISDWTSASVKGTALVTKTTNDGVVGERKIFEAGATYTNDAKINIQIATIGAVMENTFTKTCVGFRPGTSGETAENCWLWQITSNAANSGGFDVEACSNPRSCSSDTDCCDGYSCGRSGTCEAEQQIGRS